MALNKDVIIKTAQEADENVEIYEFRDQLSLITSKENCLKFVKL